MLGALLSWFGLGGSACCCADIKSGKDDLAGFVEYVVKQLVDNPNDVDVKVVEDKDGEVIQVRCCKEDIGKVVGKKGKIIMAIRSLVSGAAGRLHRRISVDVLDE
ncbi:MAG: KH domain-containing protein [Victivallaceae bacterium]|nr:KH domain-containing protein [Victivallaceae bacterium]